MKKVWRVLRSHKIGSTFYIGNTLRKLLCKLDNRLAIEDKKTSFMKCSSCKAVNFGESKRSLKSHSNEHERSAENCDGETLAGIRKKLLIGKHFLRCSNHINEVSYMPT